MILAVVLVACLLKRIDTRYVVTDQRLSIRQGLLSRTEQQARISRVQDVHTRQSLFERLLKVGTVDFDTASHDEADFAFTGVADPQEVVRAVDEAQRAADVSGRAQTSGL